MSRSRPLSAVLAVLALSGCAAFQDQGTGGDATDAASAGGSLTVLTGVYPLEYLAEEIGGERVSVGSLTPANADPHTLELSPRAVADMGAAGLVVHVSGLQAAVDDAVAATGVRALDAAEHTELLTATGHDHGHNDHAEDAHDHDGETLDPHLWLDPVRLAEVGTALAEELAAIDPDGAATYRANAERVAADLTDLDADIAAGLATCERDTIVVAHEAYGYLTSAHGLHQEGLSGIDPDAEPSPARLAEIAGVVTEHDVDTVFVESLLSPAVSQALADDLGLRTAVLDPLENQQDPDADYLDVMRANLAALQEALACSAS
ncbi:zinc transport system substrate-binding protein [Georgenia satyanarayanai]|uniref:Zinc transport system substrate-binding protein n=1 Tax=Georgenia satyanarayanai TaxID=860221 RepID=A0A2Y8ZWW5_9MICO|nr:metal ABC transporter substrate-binding protein [Georgenia satyanarayanai]PYG01655.1 zinc transport system substrate-binding protein [Georgenia satyanarayanai]SSA36455.1 zinc transport system substrate-binding protein [Georgenia satyanarayanai]